MLFSKKALGMEICQEGVKFAVVGGKREFPRLDAYLIAPFPADTVKLSLREPNVQNPSAFVAGIRESYLRLLTPIKRVSVSLPDSIGRVMLLDLETRFKNREEGRDIIRWKLKKSLPFDIGEVHLDYQVLRERETGEITTLVALISRQVVNQFEELLVEAGLEPNKLDFTTFNRYRLFANRVEMSEYVAVMTCFGRSVSILIFNSGTLEFYRSKEIPGTALDADRVFREINSSLLVHKERYPGHGVNQVYYSASVDEAELFRSVVAETVGVEPLPLDVDRIVGCKEGLTVDKKTLNMLSASLGAATRNL